jgi:signal transduction histidine kinase
MSRPARDAAAVAGASALLLAALTWLTPWPVQAAELPLSVLGAAVPLVIGASIGARWSAQRALTEEQARVAAAQAERGALAERARIAREMHDVVAHHMSMIAVRCETAPYRVSGLTEAARAEIAEIGAAARTAMTEMQGLLGVLRASDEGGVRSPDRGGDYSGDQGGTGVAGRADLAPQPSIGDLGALLEQSRTAGLRLTADLGAEPEALARSVPDAVGLTVYRIAQEALTNASRHAPDAAVELRLRRTPVGLELVVRSAPAPGAVVRAAPGSGHGVTGMRERAALHGGELAAGPDRDGGFTVRAVLPVPRRGLT